MIALGRGRRETDIMKFQVGVGSSTRGKGVENPIIELGSLAVRTKRGSTRTDGKSIPDREESRRSFSP